MPIPGKVQQHMAVDKAVIWVTINGSVLISLKIMEFDMNTIHLNSKNSNKSKLAKSMHSVYRELQSLIG